MFQWKGINLSKLMKFREEVFPRSLVCEIIEEKKANLAAIVQGFALSFDLGDKQSARGWNNNLATYAKEYKINETERVSCIQCLVQWIFHSPQRDISLQTKMLPTLTTLLHKAPSDFHAQIIPWRIIYDEIKLTIHQPSEMVNTKSQSHKLHLLLQLTKRARPYFVAQSDSHAIEEIVHEFMPKMCPHDHANLLMYQTLLTWFLPSIDTAEDAHIDCVITLLTLVLESWDWIDHNDLWNYNWLCILKQIAKDLHKSYDNMDLLNNQFLEFVFSKCLNLLGVATANNRNLANLKKKTQIPFLLGDIHIRSSFIFSKFAAFAVYSMGNRNTCSTLLVQLFELVRSYYHPSNGGEWTSKLAALLSSVSLTLEKRTYFAIQGKVEQLFATELSQLTKMLLSLSLQAVRAKTDEMKEAGSTALRSLLWIDPSYSPTVLRSLEETLASTTSPQQVISCINVLSKICFLILPPCNSIFEAHFEENMNFLLQALHTTLPGIDPNDFGKTETTLSFYCNFVRMASSQQIHTSRYQAIFSDWSYLFIQGILRYLENLNKDDLKRIQHKIRDCLVDFTPLLSVETYERCVEYVHEFVDSHTCIMAKKQYGMVLRMMLRHHKDASFDRSFDKLVDNLCVSNNFEFVSSAENLEWRLHILSEFIEASSAEFITTKVEQVRSIILLGLRHDSKGVFKASLRICSSFFHRTSCYYLLPSQESSTLESKDSIQADWYEPGKHVSCAYQLLDLLLSSCKNESDMILSESSEASVHSDVDTVLFPSEEMTKRQKLERILMVLQCLVSHAGMLLRNSIEHPKEVKYSQKGFPDTITLRLTIGQVFPASNYSRREAIGSLLLTFGKQIFEENSLFSASIIQKLASVTNLFLTRSVTSLRSHQGHKSYKNDKSITICRIHTRAMEEHRFLYPSSILRNRIWAQLQRRISNQNTFVHPQQMHENLFHLLLKLSENEYIDVRREAQGALAYAICHYFSLQEPIAKQILLNCFDTKTDTPEAAVKGNLYHLLCESVMSIIISNWSLQSMLMRGILDMSLRFERPSIQKLIYSVCTLFITIFYYPVPLVTSPSASSESLLVLEAAKQHREQSAVNQNEFALTTKRLLTSSPANWRYDILRIHLLFALHCRVDIELDAQVIQVFLDSLSSDISIVRRFSRSALTSLLALHAPLDSVMIYTNWKQSAGENNEKSTWYPQFPVQGAVHAIIRQYWNNQDWLRRVCMFMMEDHHVKTEEEEVNKSQGFHVSQLPAHLQALAHGFQAAFRKRKQMSSGVPSDVLQVLSVNTSARIVWPLSNDKELISYLFDVINASFFFTLFSVVFSAQEENTFSLECWVELVRSWALSDDRKQQITAAEMISGSQRALMNHPEHSLYRSLETNLYHPVWKEVLAGEIGFTLDWPTAVRFACTGHDPDVYMALFIRLFNEANVIQSNDNSLLLATNIASTKLVRSLSCLCALFTEASWRLQRNTETKEIASGLVSSSLAHASFPSAVVRLSLAQFINTACQLNLCSSANQDSLQEALRTSETSENKQDLSLLRETLFIWLSQVFAASSRCTFLDTMMKEVLEFTLAALKDDSNYVQTLARTMLALIAQSHFSSSVVRNVVELLEAHTKSSDWHSRMAILPVLQIVSFNHRFVLSEEDQKRVHEICIKLLLDSQIEVRELASISLSSALRGWEDQYIISLGTRFTKASRVTISESTKQDKRFFMRHGGVLGLCALVRMYPYDLPSFLVPIIMELVEHNEDQTVISASVRSTMKEFWRTHQELWHVYKTEVLSSEQAILLQNLLVSPSYYA